MLVIHAIWRIVVLRRRHRELRHLWLTELVRIRVLDLSDVRRRAKCWRHARWEWFLRVKVPWTLELWGLVLWNSAVHVLRHRLESCWMIGCHSRRSLRSDLLRHLFTVRNWRNVWGLLFIDFLREISISFVVRRHIKFLFARKLDFKRIAFRINRLAIQLLFCCFGLFIRLHLDKSLGPQLSLKYDDFLDHSVLAKYHRQNVYIDWILNISDSH